MKKVYLFISIIVVALLLFYFLGYDRLTQNSEIKVGVLFSQTGTMAASEQPVARAVLLAIEQINKQGGIDGKSIVPVVYDGASNWKKYASLANKMLSQDKVKVIFGCWTSASRKEVKPVVEKYDGLLIYPTQYEGIEESNSIVYLGATPNQQLVPAASWMFSHHGKKVFLVGSDYIFPRVANEILAHETELLGGKVIGTQYIPLGSTNVDSVIEEIIQQKPDFIFNTINGSTNVAFFKRLFELTTGAGRSRPPVMSFSLSSAETNAIGTDKMIGDYATWSYFPMQDNPENSAFLKAYKEEYGSTEPVNDPAATAFSGVYLWAQAAKQSPSVEPHIVRDYMLRGSLASPAGVIYIDPLNGHAWRAAMIARITAKKTYDIVWTSYAPIQPVVYLDFKTKAAWDLFEYQLYSAWDGSWGKS
jgi:urea transport system substrate-binding protein